jgi:hypothetical protein
MEGQEFGRNVSVDYIGAYFLSAELFTPLVAELDV